MNIQCKSCKATNEKGNVSVEKGNFDAFPREILWWEPGNDGQPQLSSCLGWGKVLRVAKKTVLEVVAFWRVTGGCWTWIVWFIILCGVNILVNS